MNLSLPNEGGSPLIQAINGNFTELSAHTFVNGNALTGTSYVPIRSFGIGAGNFDMYTAPPGKRAIILTSLVGKTRSATSNTYYFAMKINGVYYRITVNNTQAVVSFFAATTIALPTVLLEPGESLSVVSTGNAVMDLFGGALQFDVSCGLRSVKLAGPVSGNNLFYTCPPNKTAFMNRSVSQGFPSVISASTLNFSSDPGGARFVATCVTPAGADGSYSVLNPNAISATSILANAIGQVGLPGMMVAGEFITLNVDTGNPAQLAWTTVSEF